MRAKGHETELLNLALVIYIALGGFLFHWMGEFEDKRSIGDDRTSAASLLEAEGRFVDSKNERKYLKFNNSSSSDGGGVSGDYVVDSKHSGPSDRSGPAERLHQLRASSVRRMWMITNQLNILYEANWTELILAELVDFERELMKAVQLIYLQKQEEQLSNDEDQLEENVSSDLAEKKGQNGQELANLERTRRTQRKNWKRRLRSIERSLVHSLATITTMAGPAAKQNPSELGKVATVLYGMVGVPLLLLTVAKTGRSLAEHSLNPLLVLRHYCFALPLHFLCCWLGLFACLGWLVRLCCCCCCCFRPCCCPSSDSGKPAAGAKTRRAARKCCCDGQAPPKLLLRPRHQQVAQPHTVSSSTTSHAHAHSPSPQSAFFICAGQPAGPEAEVEQEVESGHQESLLGGQQKSVRFAHNHELASNSDHPPGGGLDAKGQLVERLNSPGALATALVLLALYGLAGALYLARTQRLAPVDALHAAYCLLSGTSLPAFLQQGQGAPGGASPEGHSDALQLYWKLAATSAAPDGSLQRGPEAPEALGAPEAANRTVNLWLSLATAIYLLLGLNLASACAHLACCCWGARGPKCAPERREGAGPRGPRPNGLVACAGSTMVGSLRQHHSAASPPITVSSNIGPIEPPRPPASQNGTSLVATPTSSLLIRRQSTPLGGLVAGSPAAQQDVGCQLASADQEQIDLAELYVVNRQQGGASRRPAGQAGQSSCGSREASFASEEGPPSSELGPNSQSSLCRHHQAALYGSLGRPLASGAPPQLLSSSHSHRHLALGAQLGGLSGEPQQQQGGVQGYLKGAVQAASRPACANNSLERPKRYNHAGHPRLHQHTHQHQHQQHAGRLPNGTHAGHPPRLGSGSTSTNSNSNSTPNSNSSAHQTGPNCSLLAGCSPSVARSPPDGATCWPAAASSPAAPLLPHLSNGCHQLVSPAALDTSNTGTSNTTSSPNETGAGLSGGGGHLLAMEPGQFVVLHEDGHSNLGQQEGAASGLAWFQGS